VWQHTLYPFTNMKHLNLSLATLVVCCLFFNCNTTHNNNLQPATTSQIVIRLAQRSFIENDTIMMPSGGFMENPRPKIIITKTSSVIEQAFEPNTEMNYKYITISSNEPIFLHHLHDTFNHKTFTLQPGDSAQISYNKGVPQCQVTNRVVPKLEFSTNYLPPNEPTPLFEGFLRYSKIWNKKQVDSFLTSYKLYAQNAIKAIDSVYSLGFMTRSAHTVNNAYWQSNLNNMQQEALFTPLTQLSFTAQDSLLFYPPYRSNLIEQAYQMAPQKKQVSNNINYKGIFDSVAVSTHLSPLTQQYLLYHCIKQIGLQESFNNIQTYYSKYEKLCTDSLALTDVEQSLMMDYAALQKVQDSLILSTSGRKQSSLGQVIKQNAGKVLYIDFWASWCGPCLKVMPASKKLHHQFKNQDIVFVYLSIDKDYDAWRRANNKLGFEFNKNSLLIVNKESAQFLKDIALGPIPRYVIIDKQGKLVHANAPGPEADELPALLSLLASQ